ncbi:hypothetical protein NL676_003148 [Syzygium grande]|nr:hypothetical protein NL676_003148 [Syzygium grande]
MFPNLTKEWLELSDQRGSKFSEETKLRNNQRDFVGTGKFSGTARGSCWNLTVNVGLVAQLDGNRDYDTPKWLELLDCRDGSSDFQQRSQQVCLVKKWMPTEEIFAWGLR